MKTIRNSILVVLVLGVVAVFSYQYLPASFKSALGVVSGGGENGTGTPVGREVSAATSYKIPNGGTDYVRFTLGLDATGAITSVSLVDSLKGGSSEQMITFTDNLIVMIKGKKLSELTAIDRVGKSSLTTAAFNAVLPELKKQL
jgi:hypothetical protein